MSKYNRRQFIATASVVAATPATLEHLEEKAGTTIIHHVFFWLKNAGSAADRKQLMEGLKTLSAITEVKQLLIGTPADTEKRGVVDGSYDVSELMYFESLEAQAAYQEHATHKAFVEKCSHLWAKVVVYDMLVAS
ncbi:MAG: Dabb family protein [Bacteroidota bacterium]